MNGLDRLRSALATGSPSVTEMRHDPMGVSTTPTTTYVGSRKKTKETLSYNRAANQSPTPPIVVRLVLALAHRPGPVAMRELAHLTGLGTTAVAKAVTAAEALGLLDVEHGTSRWTDDRAEANTYRVTEAGHAAIPDALRDRHTDLPQPEWRERGGNGIRGLWLVARFEGQRITTAEAAELWQCTPRAAKEALLLMSKREGSPVVDAGPGLWGVTSHAVATVEQEQQAEARAEALATENRAARYRVSTRALRAFEARAATQQDQSTAAFEGFDHEENHAPDAEPAAARGGRVDRAVPRPTSALVAAGSGLRRGSRPGHRPRTTHRRGAGPGAGAGTQGHQSQHRAGRT